MIIAKIYGGLGNQLFQYAAAKNFGLKFKQQVLIDKSWYFNIPRTNTARAYLLDKFCIEEECLDIKYNKIISKINPYVFENGKIFRIINERNLDKLSNNGNYIFDDYWQSIDYFIDNKKSILNLLTINYSTDNSIKGLLDEINKNNSVAIHIRRGDYLTNKYAALKHGVCSLDYYISAINIINLFVKEPFYYIFSDDINWAKENFKFMDNIYFIDNNYQDIPISDFLLMSNCKNHIIANSSFSWWGAWIAWSKNTSGSKNIVIAPKKWFLEGEIKKNLFPSDWMIL